VHEIGLSLVFLTPAPYVDASAANAFPDPRHRAVVSGAGIAVELTLAALATIAWTLFAPGLLRDAAMVVILIGAVSTVLFNANPLLRLDGYHLLCDLLQLPNLAARSQAWWASFWRRVIGAERDLPAGVLAAGESKWLVLHAPAALLYRMGLLLALVGWIGRQSWLLGWLAALGVFAWVAHASLRALLRPASGTAEPLARRRALQATGGLIAGALVLLFLVPAPASVVARGVVWPPDHAQLRPGAAGFVDPQLVPDGSQVANGQVVLTLSDPALEAQREKAASERSGLMAEQYQALLQDPARASDLNEQVARNAAELERAEEQLANLQLRAGTPGRAVWTREQDLPGTYARRGAMLGYVLGPEPAQVRLVLRDEDLLRVRGRVRAIEVRLADTPWTPHRGTLRNETPAATRQLPNAALGDKQGGTVPVDPGDKDGLRTTAPVFLFDVQVPDLRADRIGGRAWVKLVLPAEPVGLQWLRQARQLLVKQFSPTGQV
jgi:putative peptide zinc metalloprotease protein